MRTTALVFALVLAGAGPVAATTRTVTDCGDNSAPGQLRTLIGLSGSGDTITIGVCPITLASQLTIGVNLTISGAGASQTVIDGGNNGRVFLITGGAVAISDVTLRHGSSLGGSGGAVEVSGGSLVLTRSVVTDSVAPGSIGGGIDS